jgi:subtilisin family serine protease
MDPLELVKLRSLMNISKGRPDIVIGVIDGPVDFNHPSFNSSSLKATKESEVAACNAASSVACIHGTFVTGILCGMRDSLAPAICPESTIILRPIFNESSSGSNLDVAFPSSTPKELSNAIIETVDSGASIINLSLGLSGTALIVYHELEEAYNYARQKGVIIVAAAGNQGNIGYAALLNNKWIIPAAACDENGRLSTMSNFGPSIGIRGLMAPGVDITSTSPGGNYTKLSGTSFAAPFVTGTIALLLSVFSKATIAQIIQSLVGSSLNHSRTIIPSLLNAETATNFLKNYHRV